MNLLNSHLCLDPKLLEDLMIIPMCKNVRIYAFEGMKRISGMGKEISIQDSLCFEVPGLTLSTLAQVDQPAAVILGRSPLLLEEGPAQAQLLQVMAEFINNQGKWKKGKKEEGTVASGEVLAPSFSSFSVQAAKGLLLPLSVPGQTRDTLKLVQLFVKYSS